ncbi:hypothetical protein SAMN04488096_105346 [Mesonia phycicola]|uniref:PIN domain-containing protein n=2 Tax=Flavobacteriaceae TaxID=49546 RepID=A0A1M6EZ83_9FLAO|nr:hypothetical protein SAMN04488096_105346 [Mesonia phycicola]|tara:strand:- start:1806 stop:2219 length:414 start_codon:yes stop_codon:yes gene_type:complete
MYIFSDIELLLLLDSLRILDNSTDCFYVTEMALESPCYDYVEQNRLKRLVEEGKIKTYSLEGDFFKFSCKESIKFNGLHIMDFAAIYYCKTINGCLVERNDVIKECASTNGVNALSVDEILSSIVKEKKYMEFIKAL